MRTIPLRSTYTMRCHPPHRFPLHRLLQSSSRMSVNYTLYLSSDSMGNVPHSTSRYRHLLLCVPPRSIKNPDARSLAFARRTSDLKTGGSFPRPRVLTPTHSTAGLASRTEPPPQSAPSVSYLVGAFTPRQIGRPSCFWAVAWELGPTSP